MIYFLIFVIVNGFIATIIIAKTEGELTLWDIVCCVVMGPVLLLGFLIKASEFIVWKKK